MKRQHGLSLVELLVSLAIGVILIGGALTVYIGGRATYTLNETLARMQENAAFAMKYIEDDVRLAGMWGTHNQVAAISGRAEDNPIAGTPGNDCNANWSIRLSLYVEGSNNENPDGWDCIPDDDYMADTDVLAIRRADPTPVATADLASGQLYLRSSLLPQGQVFLGTAEPAGFSPDARNYPLHARAYYVTPTSVASLADDDQGSRAVPALRRIDLTAGGVAPTLRDREIVTGIEQLQVQFGIRAEDAPVGGAAAYVNPDSALLDPAAGNIVVAVRVWVLVRSELPEPGYEDNPTYQMGDYEYNVPNDVLDHRRLLVTRTFDLRNQS
ncbi:MAG: PilW family protein [Pseudomonadota bacterium]